MTYRRLHDPDISDAEFGEIADAAHDARPTRAELAEEPDWPAPKAVAEPCADCEHTLCRLTRHVRGWVG